MREILTGEEIRTLLEGQTIAKVSAGGDGDIWAFMMKSGETYIFQSDWDHNIAIRRDEQDIFELRGIQTCTEVK